MSKKQSVLSGSWHDGPLDQMTKWEREALELASVAGLLASLHGTFSDIDGWAHTSMVIDGLIVQVVGAQSEDAYQDASVTITDRRGLVLSVLRREIDEAFLIALYRPGPWKRLLGTSRTRLLHPPIGGAGAKKIAGGGESGDGHA